MLTLDIDRMKASLMVMLMSDDEDDEDHDIEFLCSIVLYAINYYYFFQ